MNCANILQLSTITYQLCLSSLFLIFLHISPMRTNTKEPDQQSKQQTPLYIDTNQLKIILSMHFKIINLKPPFLSKETAIANHANFVCFCFRVFALCTISSVNARSNARTRSTHIAYDICTQYCNHQIIIQHLINRLKLI